MASVSELALKRMIIDIGKRMWTRGYIAANDGNITIRLNGNEILTTPTGVSKGFMTPDMLIKMDMNGTVLSKGRRLPTLQRGENAHGGLPPARGCVGRGACPSPLLHELRRGRHPPGLMHSARSRSHAGLRSHRVLRNAVDPRSPGFDQTVYRKLRRRSSRKPRRIDFGYRSSFGLGFAQK